MKRHRKMSWSYMTRNILFLLLVYMSMIFKNLKWFCSPIDDATFASYNCIRCDTFWKNLCQIPSVLYRSSAIHVFVTKIPEALHSLRIFSLGDVFFPCFHSLNEHEAIFNIWISCVFALVFTAGAQVGLQGKPG